MVPITPHIIYSSHDINQRHRIVVYIICQKACYDRQKRKKVHKKRVQLLTLVNVLSINFAGYWVASVLGIISHNDLLYLLIGVDATKATPTCP